MTGAIARALRRISHQLNPDAWLDAVLAQHDRVRTYADLTQQEGARLALLTERLGEVATCVRLGDDDLRDGLLEVGACVAEWLEAIS